MSEDDKFFEKYLRYKIKYIELKSIMEAGGLATRAIDKTKFKADIGMSIDEKEEYEKRTKVKKIFDELNKIIKEDEKILTELRKKLNKDVNTRPPFEEPIDLTNNRKTRIDKLKADIKAKEDKQSEQKKKLESLTPTYYEAERQFKKKKDEALLKSKQDKMANTELQIKGQELKAQARIKKETAKTEEAEIKAQRKQIEEESKRVTSERKQIEEEAKRVKSERKASEQRLKSDTDNEIRRAKAEATAIKNASRADLARAKGDADAARIASRAALVSAKGEQNARQLEVKMQRDQFKNQEKLQKQQLAAETKQQQQQLAAEIKQQKESNKSSPTIEQLQLQISGLQQELQQRDPGKSNKPNEAGTVVTDEAETVVTDEAGTDEVTDDNEPNKKLKTNKYYFNNLPYDITMLY
jgi:hypothetical protein